MDQNKFILYLIYGMVFIIMGAFASSKKDKEVSHIPLVRSLKYLGVFGITHGISEWIAMIMIIDLYHGQYQYLYLINQLLKAVSFAFLMYFGISLLPKETRFKSILNKLPVALFIIWFTYVISIIVQNGIAYLIDNPNISIFILRYCMAATGSIISAVALYKNAKLMREIFSQEIEIRYMRLANIFLIYGLIDGLLIKERDFFPANIINNSFLAEYSFYIKFINIAVGLGVIYLLSKVMQTFDWEQKEKLKHIQQQKIVNEERRKLGLEIHDGIIQYIYAASLKLQYVLQNYQLETTTQDLLKEIRGDLGDTIKKTREFISKTTLETVQLEDLKAQIEHLVKVFNDNQNIVFTLKTSADLSTLRRLPSKKSSHVYYIVQEAINNVVKHSGAKRAKILLDFKTEYLHIKIIDDGIGISYDELNSTDKYGIQSMKERTQQIDGLFRIKKLIQGTEVELSVPYEQGNGKKD